MRTTVLVTILLSGCATTQSIDRAVGLANKGLGATRYVVQQASAEYNTRVQEAVDDCRHELGPETESSERAACMKSKGFTIEQIAKVEAAVQSMSDAYDMMVDALELLEGGWNVVKNELE